MAKEKERYIPPPDPDFVSMAQAGYEAWVTDKPSLVAFDTETTGFEFYDEPFCVTAAWNGIFGQEVHYFELEKYDSTPLIREILRDTPALVGHNIKFDLQKCILAGILKREEVKSYRIHDTECMAHLDDEHRLKALKKLAVSVLDEDDTIEVETKSGPNKGQLRRVPREKYELDAVRRKLKKKKDDGYHVIPRAIMVPYAKKDAEFTVELYDKLFPEIEKFEDVSSLYSQEMTLTLVFLDMEHHGLGVDIPYVKKKVSEYQNRVLVLENRIEEVVGKPIGKAKDEFNPNSNPQIKEFFSSVGYERENYDVGVLKGIKHPLAELLLQLRSDQKILGTYLMALLHGSRKNEDGVWVFHPSIRQHGTVTGRSSSGGVKGD